MGYKTTAFPNYAGHIRIEDASEYVNLIIIVSTATGCYKHAALLACSAFVPKCTGTEVLGNHTIPPCRSLCEGIFKNAVKRLELSSIKQEPNPEIKVRPENAIKPNHKTTININVCFFKAKHIPHVYVQ